LSAAMCVERVVAVARHNFKGSLNEGKGLAAFLFHLLPVYHQPHVTLQLQTRRSKSSRGGPNTKNP